MSKQESKNGWPKTVAELRRLGYAGRVWGNCR